MLKWHFLYNICCGCFNSILHRSIILGMSNQRQSLDLGNPAFSCIFYLVLIILDRRNFYYLYQKTWKRTVNLIQHKKKEKKKKRKSTLITNFQEYIPYKFVLFLANFTLLSFTWKLPIPHWTIISKIKNIFQDDIAILRGTRKRSINIGHWRYILKVLSSNVRSQANAPCC